MCGIFACKPFVMDWLENSIIQHQERGPDQNAINTFEDIGVSVNRLAITGNLEQGSQPVFSSSQFTFCVFNGAIYNTEELITRFSLKVKSKNEAVIINIASMYGVISPDYRIYSEGDRKNSEIYGATKAAIIQMTKYFAVHLAERKIRVNCVSPGGIFNPENPQSDSFIKNYSLRCPLNRMANVNEIIGGIIFLSSDAASYVTGQNLIIDGGMSCW